MIFDKFANLKYRYGNRRFWCRGYYVERLRGIGAINEIVNSGIYALDANYYDDALGVYENGGGIKCDILML